MTTVLMTGAAGYVASYLLPAFRERFDLRLVDNRDVDGLGRPVDGLQVRDIADLTRMDEYRDLFQGVDAVVHLAHLRAASDRLHDRYLAERGDVDMAYIVYQLALDEGVKRVVVASSNHATDFYERPLRAKQLDTVYPESAAQRPLADNFYVWAKESYEHLGFVYASGVAAGPTVGEVRPEDRMLHTAPASPGLSTAATMRHLRAVLRIPPRRLSGDRCIDISPPGSSSSTKRYAPASRLSGAWSRPASDWCVTP